MRSPFAAPLARARRAVRLYGGLGASRRAVAAARATLGRTGVPDPFDERYGTDTARQVRLERLTVHGENRDLGVRYQASDPGRVRRVLLDLDLELDITDHTFVDLGSGKGRVVLVASTLPFRQVVGVEFSEELDRVARANLERFPAARRRAADVVLVCADVVDYEFPPTPLVVYLYNPFLGPVMGSVMAHLGDSLDRHPRPCVVVLEGDQSLARWVLAAGFVTVRPGVFARRAPVEASAERGEDERHDGSIDLLDPCDTP